MNPALPVFAEHPTARRTPDFLDRTRRMNLVDVVLWVNFLVMWSVSYWWQTRLITLFFIGLVLFRPQWRHLPAYWLAIAFAWMPQLILNWKQNEDHVYLAIFWIAATGLSLAGGRKHAVLSTNARLLIGLCFLIAALWKTFSPEFMSGEVLGFKMLQDFRFREMLTGPVMGMSPTAMEHFDSSYALLRGSSASIDSVPVTCPANLATFSAAMTWWTIAIEWTVAVLFLFPRIVRQEGARHLALLLFVATTYFVVPVMGFCNTFCVMGYAQVSPDKRRWRVAFLATLVVANLWYYWRSAILSLIGSA